MRDPKLDRILPRIGSEPIDFHNLMARRVQSILLVSSLYDSFTLEEGGSFTELLFHEYLDLNLRYAPRIQRVSTADEALKRLEHSSFDMVISMVRVGEMDIREFGRAAHALDPDLPVILLAYSTRELALFKTTGMLDEIDRAFAWQGDARLFVAIVKYVEDRWNAKRDSERAGVKWILLVEDSIRFYSAYLPMLYTEIMEQTQALMHDSVNQMHRLLRMRARPKILLATTFEEGLALYQEQREHVLGAVLDARFPQAGQEVPQAGLHLARIIKEMDPSCPILIQSSEEANRLPAESVGAAFVNKRSATLLLEVRGFLQEYLGFGDFLFRQPDGRVECRVGDLREMYGALKTVSDESLIYHAHRNDFSTWLMARTEFDLAKALRPRRVDEFPSTDSVRQHLLSSLRRWREQARAGRIEEFSQELFDQESDFVKIGSGSLGGKGRGLAFFNALLNAYAVAERFPDVRIFIPATAVVATGVFDRFMEQAGYIHSVLEMEEKENPPGPEHDRSITEAFVRARLPEGVVEQLRTFLEAVHYPLAVRSSSLLEDSPSQPFAGIYRTYMLPNNEPTLEDRLEALCRTIKMVYASTYYADAISYIRSTPSRLEEEKMAVVIQELVGRRHEDRLYPSLAGVVRSYNFYPMEGMSPEDGVASIALGLGMTVVDGGRCIRFCPAQPRRLYQFSSTEDTLANSQREFWALSLIPECPPEADCHSDSQLVLLGLDQAQEDGILPLVGSTYSPDSDIIREGTGRPGVKLVTMTGVLKGRSFPLAEILQLLLQVGTAGFSCHVEMEFAVNLPLPGDTGPPEFGFLQVRPMPLGSGPQVRLGGLKAEDAICLSSSVLGSGMIEGVKDLVYVRPDRFDRSRSEEVARHVEGINWRLHQAGRSYILVGPGRWGSSDHWLGIPVSWSQISSVRCIVETPLMDMDVIPSQGTHFFQNITSLGIGYFTVGGPRSGDRIDWDWLQEQVQNEPSDELVRHLRFDQELSVMIDRRSGRGVILKPGRTIPVD